MTLPRQLASWAPLLTPFASDLSRALAPWLPRLAAAIGPQKSGANRRGEPDGVSGLSRRGTYDRLLITEWAVLEEVPDEFVRRAAAREHLFLERAYRAPAASTRTIVLFDTGPDQLGSARLAHLALLLVLARRAEIARGTFAWGVLQGDRVLTQGASGAAVLALLQARSAHPPTNEECVEWTEALAEDAGETFVVGGARTPQLPGAQRLHLEEADELDERALLLHAGGRPLRLPLPPPDACVRLLRDPFRASAPVPSRVTLPDAETIALRFLAGGRLLVVLLADGRLARHNIPNSPRAQPGRLALWRPPPGQRIVGVTSRGARVLLLTAMGVDTLVLHDLGPRLGPLKETRVFPVPPGKIALNERALPRLDPIAVTPERVYFIDDDRQMIATDGDSHWNPIGTDVVAARSTATTIEWVCRSDDRWLYDARQEKPMTPRDLGPAGDCRAFFARGHELPMVTRPDGSVDVSPPTGTRIVAPPGATPMSSDDGLLWLGAARDTLWLATGPNETAEIKAPSPITFAASSGHTPHVAFVTRDGHLILHDAHHHVNVLEIGFEERPP